MFGPSGYGRKGECVAESRGWEVDVSVSEKSRRYALMAGVKSFIQYLA